jgi:hypothetical protein
VKVIQHKVRGVKKITVDVSPPNLTGDVPLCFTDPVFVTAIYTTDDNEGGFTIHIDCELARDPANQ